MNGYVGRFILQNGVDLYGNRWPLLYFDNFGDFPNVIPMYISGVSTYIFEPTVFAIRFPIALLGALTVFPLYGLIVEVFNKRWLGLVGALLLAITPWHLVLSRATAEGVTAAFVFMVALWLLVGATKKSRPSLLYGSIPLFLLTYFLYPSYRIVVPLTWAAVPFLWKGRRMRMVSVTIMVAFFLVTLGIAQTPWGKGRFEQTSIFAQGHEVDALTQRFVYGSGGSPVLLTRFFHNKGIVGVREFLHQYSSYFSGDFLLSRGGLPDRYKAPDVGVLYYTLLVALALLLVPPLILNRAGIQANREPIIRPDAQHIFAFLIWIILMVPIPAALTRDDVPNVHRTALMGVMYIFPVLYAIGQLSTWRLKRFPKHAVVLGVLGLLLFLEFAYFVRIYSTHANSFQSLWRHDEMAPAVRYIKDHATAYNVVAVPSHHNLALLYLMANNDFDKKYAGQFKRNIYIPTIDNITFYQSDCPSTFVEAEGKILDPYIGKRVLVIDRVECQGTSLLETTELIPSALKLDAYRILEYEGAN
jgi:hypothetical protein